MKNLKEKLVGNYFKALVLLILEDWCFMGRKGYLVANHNQYCPYQYDDEWRKEVIPPFIDTAEKNYGKEGKLVAAAIVNCSIFEGGIYIQKVNISEYEEALHQRIFKELEENDGRGFTINTCYRDPEEGFTDEDSEYWVSF